MLQIWYYMVEDPRYVTCIKHVLHVDINDCLSRLFRLVRCKSRIDISHNLSPTKSFANLYCCKMEPVSKFIKHARSTVYKNAIENKKDWDLRLMPVYDKFSVKNVDYFMLNSSASISRRLIRQHQLLIYFKYSVLSINNVHLWWIYSL